MTRSTGNSSSAARIGGALFAAVAAGGLAAACVSDAEPALAGARSAVTDPPCPQQFVTGYYAGYYAGSYMGHPAYQAPEHVDMTAMTHLVFARIYPGGASNDTVAGYVYPDGEAAMLRREIGPGAPDRTIEEYLIGRAHAAGRKALIMLGGDTAGDGFRASLVPAVRTTLIADLLAYMESRDYDGVEVDFEGVLDANDEELLEAFLVELRAAANARPRYTDRPVIIIYPGGLKNLNLNQITDQVTDHDLRMVDLVDQYNLMSYGAGWYGGGPGCQGWDTTMHSPLTGHTCSRPMDIASTIQLFVDRGAPRCKIGMGIGFFGMMYAPPYVGPGEHTDNDFHKWDNDDNTWNYAKLNKNGYLAHGTYIWDTATQTGYRSYPGGFTGLDGNTVGYLSYEDEAGIAAKGAWAKSTAPGSGAGGTILWLVNYGTTNGVNNPLLTAVKRAFLDPAATEPGPNPNPAPLPPLPAAAGTWHPHAPPPPPPPPPVPAEDLGYILATTTTWSTGYCGTLTVENHGTASGSWTVEVPFADTITSLWDGVYARTASSLLVSGPTWDPVIVPGQSRTVGYCAVLGPPPPSGPAQLTSSVAMLNDWSSGWLASVVVTNTGGSTASNWSITVPMPSTGTIVGVYSAEYDRIADQITLRPPSWKRDLAPRESIEIQIQARR